MSDSTKKRLAVWKFASCDGCQLSLLDCEDELLAVARSCQISHFLEASSVIRPGPYDVSLVEGSLTTPEDLHRIQWIRDQSRIVVSLGACAVFGGVQALRNFARTSDYLEIVYPIPGQIDVLDESLPISAVIPVDFELRGCPIDSGQLLEVLKAFLQGRTPKLPSGSVCLECKRHGNVCVWVANGTMCMGPVTHAGCGALCPAHGRGCYGCFGPSDTDAPEAFSAALAQLDTTARDATIALRTYAAWPKVIEDSNG